MHLNSGACNHFAVHENDNLSPCSYVLDITTNFVVQMLVKSICESLFLLILWRLRSHGSRQRCF